VGGGQRAVVWTPTARDCVDEILAFIAADSPAAAAKVLDVILAAAESLSVFAERGRIVPEIESRAIREIFVYRYRLMYQVSGSKIRVLEGRLAPMQEHFGPTFERSVC
jgi:toxin ParE1/3/4